MMTTVSQKKKKNQHHDHMTNDGQVNVQQGRILHPRLGLLPITIQESTSTFNQLLQTSTCSQAVHS
jgi:hypothetical protein